MASTSARGRSSTSDGSLPPALAVWNPLFAGPSQLNGLRKVAAEWQAFVGRRVEQDFHLMQRLSQSRTPDQVIATFTDYWAKAAEDYGNEVATMTKLTMNTAGELVEPSRKAR
jgi:hypothetical protein